MVKDLFVSFTLFWLSKYLCLNRIDSDREGVKDFFVMQRV